MSSAIQPIPLRATMAGFHRFSVQDYEKLVEIGLITPDDRLELLKGYLVNKMSQNPPHAGAVMLLQSVLFPLVPVNCCSRSQLPIRLTTSVPEPDFAVFRGSLRQFLTRHPNSDETCLVIEVADSSLESDRTDKLEIYAENNLPIYWIVNLADRQLEVYTHPDPNASTYRTRTDYAPGQHVPFVLDGQTIAMIPVINLLP